jgi:four helix bundle protein
MQLLRADHPSSGKDGFEDLQCYKLALDVMLNAHQLADSLPAKEKYDLVQQLRRASKSVSANIAEGYGRFHYLDTLRFYSIARGSLNETLNHLITAKLLAYVEEDYYQDFYELIRESERTLNGLMHYVRDQRRGADLHRGRSARESQAAYEADFAAYVQEQEMESPE